MLKNIVITLSCLSILGVFPSAVSAEERGNPLAGEEFTAEEYVMDAFDAANRGVEVVFPYTPNHIYQIYLQEGFITDIKLPPGESLKYVGAGDTSRWIIDTSTIGSAGSKATHIFIKPIQRGISTNLVINTDKHIYQLTLISGSSYNPIVSWQLPKSAETIRQEDVIKTYNSINPKTMNFRYTFNHKNYSWAPALVFNTESKTYLKMRPEISNNELPVFYILDSNNKLTLVPYRFIKGYIIIDRLFDKAALILGKEKIIIKRQE